jgi:hypothetical protein
MKWGKTRAGESWHIVEAIGPSRARFLCGLWGNVPDLTTKRPGKAKTCESCLRKEVKTG